MSYEISCKTKEGEAFGLPVTGSETIADVAAKLVEKCPSYTNATLLFKGKICKPGQSLEDVGATAEGVGKGVMVREYK
jgi:hypothetical protein